MRILFCNYEYPPLGGGGGVINALLAEELATRHQVTVLTSQGRGLPRETTVNDVRVIRVPVLFRKHQTVANLLSMSLYVAQGIRVGRALVRGSDYDVINTHFVLPTGPVGHHLARRACVPNVLSLHGGDLYDPSKFTSPHRHALLRWTVRYLLRRADRIVGQSSNTLANMRRFYTPELKGELIPLGIRRPPPATADRRQYGFSDQDLLFVTVGRLVARKALDQLVDTMAQLDQNHTRLVVIGSGPLEPELRQQAEALGIADRIHLLGQVDEEEKFRILHMCDMYASTSQHEGFGIVFLEAMACGLPVVCYDHGGQTDFLRDGETGYLVPLNDRAAFRRCCVRLVDRADLRKAMGDNNRQQVEDYYIDRCAERYEQVFAEAIDRFRRRAK